MAISGQVAALSAVSKTLWILQKRPNPHKRVSESR